MDKKEKTVTVEGRTPPRPLTASEKQAASFWRPGHSVGDRLHDHSGNELMSRSGEDTELTTKTRLRSQEIPMLATRRAIVNRLNLKQQYCARCSKPGIPVETDEKGKPKDTIFKCSDPAHPQWRPHYWDSFSMALDEILAGRVSLDGKEREEFIEHRKASNVRVRENIDREITPVGGEAQA